MFSANEWKREEGMTMFIRKPVPVEPELGKLDALCAAHESKWITKFVVDSR